MLRLVYFCISCNSTWEFLWHNINITVDIVFFPLLNIIIWVLLVHLFEQLNWIWVLSLSDSVEIQDEFSRSCIWMVQFLFLTLKMSAIFLKSDYLWFLHLICPLLTISRNTSVILSWPEISPITKWLVTHGSLK